MLDFRLLASDSETRARRGVLETAHGPIETPVFMAVGTRASVTSVSARELGEVGAQVVLANTYHLLLRPGPEPFRRVGGVHAFMRWSGPVLTDSGGFQIYSLATDRTLNEKGARFRSYVDQRMTVLSPERSIEMQTALGSDIMMALDVCIPSRSEESEHRAAMERTHRWALRSLNARTNETQGLFAIVQGGLSRALRRASLDFLTQHPFDGFALGGLAVGDTRSERNDIVAYAADLLPKERPRYLMGVGTPPDLLESIALGVDMFDCVLPTAMGWQGTAFTSSGRVRITRTANAALDLPLDEACACETCRNYSRSYLHHLFKCSEPLAPRLLCIHNLHYYHSLIRAARAAIERGTYGAFMREMLPRIDCHEHNGVRAAE